MPITREDNDKIVRAAERLVTSRRVFIITGAGVSADSGLPTYRGIGGLYENQHTDEGVPIEYALSGEMMENRPELTWKYLAQMEKACSSATFNRAHEVIAAMQDRFDVWVLTQNIDGFHKAAGSRNVIDIHGDLHNLECVSCDWRTTVADYSGLGSFPPRCPSCGDVIRPDVVLFGEQLSYDKCRTIEEEWNVGFDIVFSIGTTSVFPYIAQPVYYARRTGIPTIEINPGTTSVSRVVDYHITTKAAETMYALWNIIAGKVV